MISIKNVSKKFEGHQIIENFSLDIKKGQIISFLGPSGCGKTTLLNMIMGLESIDSGMILNNSLKTSCIFQEDRLLPWKNLYQNIKIVRPDLKEKEILDIIDLVGLKGFEYKYPQELSGGMRQRSSIARAVAYDGDFIIMDEPFKSLDYTLRFSLLDLVGKIFLDLKKTVLFVTHDIDEALLLSDKIIVLSKNPLKIEQEFDLGYKDIKRDIMNVELIKIKQEIIKIFSN